MAAVTPWRSTTRSAADRRPDRPQLGRGSTTRSASRSEFHLVQAGILGRGLKAGRDGRP
jgi:hypothetical protein